MKPLLPNLLHGPLLLLIPLAGVAQPAFEFANGSGPAGNGSVTTSQLITFKNNALNPTTGTYTTLTPTTTATFSISNQQYTLPATQNPNAAVLSFGANINASGKTPGAMATFSAMNTVSAAPASDFSATQYNIGAGISTTTNYATELFTSAMGLYNANSPTNGTYYIADLTVTFNLPVTDPVIHIVGLGGTFGALGLTTQLSLATTGVTLTELSGSPEFSVLSTSILNTAANPSATTGSGAASGSVMVNGTVSSLTFHIYLHGNGKTPTWSNTNEHTGDAWMMGISAVNTYTALAVGPTSFTAKAQTHSVNLQWTTATETNSKYFTIERSTDGANWTAIGQVPAAGNSDQPLQYSFTDYNPASGNNYYRFQETNENNTPVYSPIRDVDFNDAAVVINWYPNPVRDRLTVTATTSLSSITLTTLDGRTLQTIDGFTSGQTIDFSRYPFGIYFLIIRTTAGQTRVTKIERSL